MSREVTVLAETPVGTLLFDALPCMQARRTVAARNACIVSGKPASARQRCARADDA
jgi:hypothetical protein